MTASTSAAGTQVDVNGASLFVAEQGQGDPLLLIHMGLSSSVSWAGIAPLLAEHFRVITFDNRGHGRSTNPAGVLRYEQLADDAAALIEALGIERPFVGGWSDGGEVAKQFGLRHPGRARALVIGGTALEIGSEAAKAGARRVFHVGDDGEVDLAVFAASDAGRMLIPMMRQWHPGGERQWQSVVKQSVGMWLGSIGLSREQVAAIGEPALVVAGDRDEFAPVEDAAQLYRQLPDAELAILPGASHLRPIFEPATLARVVGDFLQRH